MKSTLVSLGLTLLAGGVYALSYPSFIGSGWLPLIFISLPFYLWRLEVAPHLKSRLSHVLAFNLGLNLFGYYWIPHTLREFGNLPYLISLFLGLTFSFILQPHWWLYAFWRSYRPNLQWYSAQGLLLTAFIITILERFTPQQFPSFAGSPWLHLTPYLGLSPILGVMGFSFFTYWISLEIFTQLAIKKFRFVPWMSFSFFVLINALFPLSHQTQKSILSLRIVQANIGNFLKIQSEQGEINSFEAVRNKYEALSRVRNGFRPDLIVWPETAYPDTFYNHNSELPEIFQRIINDTGAEMLIGGYDHDHRKDMMEIYESTFNSSLLISKNKVKQAYHKNILIPFGETLPFGPLNSKLVSLVPAVSLFARGQGTPKMVTKDGFHFVTPICYEILESNYMRSLLNQWGNNHFIVNHTNDSWYGNTAEPFQHLFLSKWRALEFNLPIIRSTNTGITSVIFPDGSESQRLTIGQTGNLDLKIPLGSGNATIYQKYGAYPTLILFIFLFFLTFLRERMKSRLK